MSGPLSVTGIATSLALPWLLGIIWMLLVLGRSGRWNYWILAGYGYLAGILLTTLVIRAWDLCGFALNFQGLAGVILVLTFGGLAALLFHAPRPPQRYAGPGMQRWERIVVTALILLVAYRYSGIATEILLRPLYPWDAWMNWAPKAVNWFHNGQLINFISPEQWLKHTEETLAYTTGATNAWKYPVTVPLVQLWGMLGAGAVDQNYSNLPWLFAPLAFALALYGHLKLIGVSVLLATVPCYLFLSLPFVNVHSALAGYADIWLAIYFGSALLSLQEWQRERQTAWAALTVIFAVACIQLKLPGLVLGAIVLSAMTLLAISTNRKTTLILLTVFAMLATYTAVIGIEFYIPAVGYVEINPGTIEIPYLGSYDLQYHPVTGALLTAAFSMYSWNIFWYLMVAFLAAKMLTGDLLKPASVELLVISATLLFYGLTFYFTHIHIYVLDFTTVNRALLYVVPGFLFYLFRTIHHWNETSLKGNRAVD